MPNSHFRFQQFLINQENSAMKVTTEGCLFGAWIADQLNKESGKFELLDIGTGTGLLSLMIKQKAQKAMITAIEIEQNAFAQARENIQRSPWKEDISVSNIALQTFVLEEKKFAVIVCNPPFFSKNQKSSSPTKNLAIHDEKLSSKELATCCYSLLETTGRLFVLYPPFEMENFKKHCLTKGLHCLQTVSIKDRLEGKTLRHFCEFSFSQTVEIEQEKIMKNNSGEYTPEFQRLLEGYYL